MSAIGSVKRGHKYWSGLRLPVRILSREPKNYALGGVPVYFRSMKGEIRAHVLGTESAMSPWGLAQSAASAMASSAVNRNRIGSTCSVYGGETDDEMVGRTEVV